ncbi:hypothetical protein [Mucilaginibacter celer]|uniref:Uncharacterized protein n=1 Tax=Mucilaginibacter celer TaxID=2305508 RepID=A0A494VLJ6_9SPHI|nr:hypothetical protein [Mucilaginibacter celer]AYL94441.1 hypothetical protein HYN43_003605 [Mucilaginibacter celer]
MMQNNWNILVLSICPLIAAVSVWKEIRRPNKRLLGLRIIAVFMAIIALACIAIPIKYQTDITASNQSEAVLITDGFSPDSLSAYKNLKQFTLNANIKKRYPNLVLLDKLSHLSADSGITRLHILGDGLSEFELSQLNCLSFSFHPEQFKQGVTAVNWNSRIKTGDELKVQGTYKNSSPNKIKLLLEGLGTPLDSAFIKPETTAKFELKNIPKISGKAVYRLLTISGEDTVNSGNIPFRVESATPLKVLMLTSSPDFETRFLKNWLSEKGYAVALRSTISKDKFRTEFINRPAISLENISGAVLDKFDLLIGDLSTLKAISPQNSSALKAAVMQSGFGVIIRADSTAGNSWLQSSFKTLPSQGRDTLGYPILLRGDQKSLAALTMGQSFIKLQDDIQPLVTNTHGHLLAATSLTGNGKLVYTVINNSFSWALSGNKVDYAKLWSALIQQAARKAPPTESWDVTTDLPSVSSPVDLQLKSTNATIATVGEADLSPSQNPLLPFEYHYQYRPKTSGWQLIKAGNATNWWYVYGGNEWQSLRKLKKQTDTRRYSLSHPHTTGVTKPIQKKATILVSKIYPYILLLLACTFLWAEAKTARSVTTSRKGRL